MPLSIAAIVQFLPRNPITNTFPVSQFTGWYSDHRIHILVKLSKSVLELRPQRLKSMSDLRSFQDHSKIRCSRLILQSSTVHPSLNLPALCNIIFPLVVSLPSDQKIPKSLQTWHDHARRCSLVCERENLSVY